MLLNRISSVAARPLRTPGATALLIFAGAALAAPGALAGDPISWTNDSGGPWTAPLNWSGALVPVLADCVTIAVPGTYLISLESQTSISGLDITNPDATLGLGGNLGRLTVHDSDIINEGAIVLNYDDQPSFSFLRFTTGEHTLSGSGEIVLAYSEDSIGSAAIETTLGAIMTQVSTHTIRGGGTLNADLVNNGLIRADDADLPMTVGRTIDQTGGGVMEADGTGAELQPVGTVVITGGTVRSVNDGLVRIQSGAPTFVDVVFEGFMDIDTLTARLEIDGAGMTNDGFITVNADNDTLFNTLQGAADSGDLVVDGVGVIALVAPTAPTQAKCGTLGSSIIFDKNQTIVGHGQLFGAVTVLGALRPSPVMLISGPLQMGPVSSLEISIDIDEEPKLDPAGTGVVQLRGTLQVVVDPAVPLEPFARFTVVDGDITDTFDTVLLPPLAAPTQWKVFYDANDGVDIVATCEADTTGDGIVDLADLNQVLANFNTVQLPDNGGDATGDGFVDLADLNVVLAVFNTSC